MQTHCKCCPKKNLTIHSPNCSSLVDNEDVQIENQMTATAVFPDSSLPTTTDGGFANQEEFMAFVMEKQKDSKWSSSLHARPQHERLPDCEDETLALAFPLQFPFGHTGLPNDPAVKALSKLEGWKNHTRRTRKDVLLKHLQHGKSCFHCPMFNLIVQNTLVKDAIFLSCKIQCNVKCADGTVMAEKCGRMTADQLQRAIHNSRRNASVQHSARAEDSFLKSLTAACRHLPHSTEAAKEARKMCFSCPMMFGMPAIFPTVTPDDNRSFRTVVCACTKTEKQTGEHNPDDFSQDQVLLEFKVRETTRSDFPGLCAEDCQRITHLVAKHIFKWDWELNKCKGIGLFGEVPGWCLAAEEQGRKTLHGHFLIFIKDWKTMLRILQKKGKGIENQSTTFRESVTKAKRFCENATSATLFSDCCDGEPLSQGKAVFHHENCRSKRREEVMLFTVNPMENQQLREMRHKTLCHKHMGGVAKCEKCQKIFSVDELVENALNTHFSTGTANSVHRFPGGNHNKRLDTLVHELQKDHSWLHGTNEEQAKRHFASNALVNVHLTSHTNRCFKKGEECFANLPAAPCENTKIMCGEQPCCWSNFMGEKEGRFMFRFEPKRRTEDSFINTHHPLTTSLLGCNNNVMVGMNGRLVFHVTSCGSKSTQEEESAAFQSISRLLLDVLRKQASDMCALLS